MKYLPITEYKNQRVLTTEQLATVYETDVDNIKINFNRNKERFVEGEHYFVLKGSELKAFKSQVTESYSVNKFSSALYLWTRKGASRHCKLLGTNKAWEQFDLLEENYYNPRPSLPSGEELIALAVIEAQKTIDMLKNDNTKLLADNKRMKPKEIFADAVATSHTSILIGDLAKLIKQNGVEIGQKRLFDWLRENGYLIKRKGADWNMPTQKSMELELFEVKESTTNNPDGSVRINKTTKVTGKGQQYFINKFVGQE